MKLKIQKTMPINSLEDWRAYGHPQRDNQWKDGRSAKLLAQYTLSKQFEKNLQSWMKECGLPTNQDLVCEPEYVTQLPARGRGRNHDLLISGNDFVIGVEAKVLEDFQSSIQNHLEGENQQKRVNELLKYIGKEGSEENNIKYELLTGFVGTMIEAISRGCSKCLFLVIVFTGDGVKARNNEKGNAKKNEKDYDDFCKFIDIENGGKKTFKNNEFEITCAIKRVEVEVEAKKCREEIDTIEFLGK
jgi:hypothetical protein